MRRAQNSRQDLDQAREENQESQRGKCRESLREGERHEHQRKCIRGAAELRRKQASPADFISHSRGADDAKTNAEKSGRMGGWSCNVIPRNRTCYRHRYWLVAREPECERPGEQIERDGNTECLPQPKRGQKKEARDKRSHNRARCVDPVEPREARSEFG